MTPEDLEKRFKAFALRVIKLVATLPRGPVSDVVGRQLVRAATSTAANYRASRVARSRADFIYKLGIVEEEVDESGFWIDFAADAGLCKRHLISDLLKESKELFAITVSSRKTAKSNHDAAPRRPASRRR